MSARLPSLVQVLDACYESDKDDARSHITDDLEALVRRLARARPKDVRLQALADLLAERVRSLDDFV